MGSRVAVAAAVAALTIVAGSSSAVAATGDPAQAALQVALYRQGFYSGAIDGVAGPATAAALRSFQAAHGVTPDGLVRPETTALLGRFTPRKLGTRQLRPGLLGWDVAELQFALAWHGFPSGAFDGRYGDHLVGAVARFQRFAGLTVDGIAGPATIAALNVSLPAVPIRLAAPVTAPLGDPFGPRGDRFHAGIDLLADAGTPVHAAAPGRVVWVGSRPGFGLLVTVAHGFGVRTLYAHLSTADVGLGDHVETGAVLGLVGSTGDATGPHLHFEVRVDGAAVDPVPALAPDTFTSS